MEGDEKFLREVEQILENLPHDARKPFLEGVKIGATGELLHELELLEKAWVLK
jgi:hypothetical protein